MIIVLGLVIVVAAVVVGVAAVVSNGGHGHALTHGFSVFGYHVTGSTGRLFLYGVVVGAIVVFGLSLLLSGARRTSRRGQVARGELKTSRRETVAVSQDRDSLIDQRDDARADTSAALRTNASSDDQRQFAPAAGERKRHMFGHRPRQQVIYAGVPNDQVSPTVLEPTTEWVGTEGEPVDNRA
jgi:hypothetical protein